ncbi:metal-binding domain of Ada [Leptospira fainei serovar Hurstbridge str. BUT 6]|uniref:DNA-3-methyladenine glycosylase II n=1 Tax=Leptospira fainei serovar Hurstbridge str. BUT 6 TaxID=1193011 RepID=S3W5X2_9LEPT|nr:DNA-3-methyladenine glycosylase 2 family protein [Leptospira fainei]EPG75557.1 metal-binding domain of Ada [Leptospira fainei serovar Hurstbridge str. BUT 6]
MKLLYNVTRMLDANICYQAMSAHDARFDGIFFVAVKSTMIYCRPVCRVKLPLQKNCSFYPSAAAAEVAGYRPCLRCRPELAPGYSPMEAVSRLASQALQMIDEGALNKGSIEDLADDFGVTSRHLRRVIKLKFGVSPIELAQTQRLLLAKRLLTDTSLRITDIAFTSGFSSLRRFNTLFKSRYRMVPGQFRKSYRPTTKNSDIINCDLSFRPPFDWNAITGFLHQRILSGVEAIQYGKYLRTASIEGATGIVSVSPIIGKNILRAQISSSLLPALIPILSSLRKLFDLNAEPISIAHHLGKLSVKNPGLRVPGSFDPFEVCIRAILGQQISVKAATTLAARYVRMFGLMIETGIVGLTYLTPSPERVADSSVKRIASLGLPAKRAETILAFSKAVVEKKVSLKPDTNFEKQIGELTSIPGIGDWTAQYIAMRVFGWPDSFPNTDLGIYKALGEKNPNKVLKLAETWRPWRSYAAIHLWKSLEE